MAVGFAGSNGGVDEESESKLNIEEGAMALGIAGSNGGVDKNNSLLTRGDMMKTPPLEVSYFANNECNLRCRHCYVGYENRGNALSVEEWFAVFEQCLALGALSFGNVGREPTLCWEKTIAILWWLAERKKTVPRLRFGLVTNATLLNEEKIADLEAINPTYLDISCDGSREVHNVIRGSGTHERLVASLQSISKLEVLREKVFVSFTLNRLNASCIDDVVRDIYAMGYRKLLISPYVTLDQGDALYLPNKKIISTIDGILQGEIVDFSRYSGLEIYFKTDFTTTRPLIEEMKNVGIINVNELFMDGYGLIFNKYDFGSSKVYFNCPPSDPSLKTAIRISHDGYVGNCLDMFHDDYPVRAVGNVREKSIKEMLR